MLRFLCRSPHAVSTQDGDEEPWASLALAAAECVDRYGGSGRVLVLDTREERASDLSTTVLNVVDGRYLPPEAVEAAGGYVVRRTSAGPELLLIHRRGAWDLPKGKLDAGETPEAGALREVSEEIGVPIGELTLGRSLGTTVHGYPHPKRATFAVKTTHWFAMTCASDRFDPQASEDITSVEWVPWHDAGRRLGFETLRAHHAGIDGQNVVP